MITSGGIYSNNTLQERQINATSIAYAGIQSKRSDTRVPCGPGGVLHDYVPFHFCPRSPMLFANHHGRVQGYQRGQSEIVHLVSNVKQVQDLGQGCVFTDGHATMKFTHFYDDTDDLDKLDWEVIGSKIWNDTDVAPDRKRKKQAEFLVRSFFPWHLVLGIGVYGESQYEEVVRILAEAGTQTKVKVTPQWYY